MTNVQEVAITFYDESGFGDGHAAIDIKCRNWPDDLGDNLVEIDQQRIWDRTQEDWHEAAASIAHAHGYSACFTEGRSGGWLVPFRQIDATGQLQRYGGEFPQWSGMGGDKGHPTCPDVTEQRERETFVAFRDDIEALLELVPEMARQNAELYREDMASAKSIADDAQREAARRDAIVQEADERFTDRREVADALPPFTHGQANIERFDIIAKMVRDDWHEADEQGIEAIVLGRRLDNAFGDYLDPNEPEHLAEIVVVLTENGNPYCVRNLATVLSEAAAYRRAVQNNQLDPADCGGPSL